MSPDTYSSNLNHFLNIGTYIIIIEWLSQIYAKDIFDKT